MNEDIECIQPLDALFDSLEVWPAPVATDEHRAGGRATALIQDFDSVPKRSDGYVVSSSSLSTLPRLWDPVRAIPNRWEFPPGDRRPN
jgi:hypothetical protein